MKYILVLATLILATSFSAQSFAVENLIVKMVHLDTDKKWIKVKITSRYDDKTTTLTTEHRGGTRESARFGMSQNETNKFKVYAKRYWATEWNKVSEFQISTNDANKFMEKISHDTAAGYTICLAEDQSDKSFISNKSGYKKNKSAKIDRSLSLVIMAAGDTCTNTRPKDIL